MNILNYKIDGIFIACIISGALTTVFSLVGQNYHFLIFLIFNVMLGYFHKPTRLTTKTEAAIG